MQDEAQFATDLYFQIDELIERDRVVDARRVLRKAFSAFPDDAENHFWAAKIELFAEAYDEAMMHVSRFLAAEPHDIEGRLLLAQVHKFKRDFGEAERLFLEVLREQPDNAFLYAGLAEIMIEALQLERARALVDEALRLDPTDSFIELMALYVDLVEGKAGPDDPRLERLIRDEPEAEETLGLLLGVLVDAKRFREASHVAEALLRINPHEQHVVDAIVELRMLSHWSSAPLWPLKRWGWAGSAGLYLLAFLSIRAFRGEPFAGALSAFYLGYVVYSWVQPPLLKLWLRR